MGNKCHCNCAVSHAQRNYFFFFFRPMLSRAGKALGFTRKNKCLYASERDAAKVCQARQAYQALLKGYEVNRLKFMEETVANIAMMRHYGRTIKGVWVVDRVPKNFGRNVTILGTLSCQGLEGVMTVEGATDAAVFRAYVRQMLVPTLQSGKILIMDNLSAHKVPGIREAIEAAGAQLLYLLPYSPDYSPIELCWSKLKAMLRAVKACNRELLDGTLPEAIDTITPSDARG